MKTNNFGLDMDKADKIIERMNALLASYQVYYQNLRSLHWNIRGRKFFTIHPKLEEFYNEAAERVDEIAERILALGGDPLQTFTEYLKHSTLSPVKDITKDIEALEVVDENLKSLHKMQSEILEHSQHAGDEVTADIMIGYMRADEKKLWMIGVWLE